MKNLLELSIPAAIGALTAAGLLSIDRPAAPATATAVSPRAPLPSDEIRELREQLERLESDWLDVARSAPSARTSAESSASETPLGSEGVRFEVGQQTGSGEPALDETLEHPDLSSTIAAVFEAGVDTAQARELWAEAAARGQLHELLAAMEERLQDVPETASKHFDRGRAYYAAARAFPQNVDGNWWVDSDRAFSLALELDPHHWEARYAKAHNMSFWPTVYGGQAEAVRHFEILAEQQTQMSSEPRHALTYLWLGNLYDQQGRSDLARKTWKRGLDLFPGNDSLQRKLNSLGL